ncbi:MAG: xanthine dehydrogenase small subunit [Myxococcota bacterium]|nr:xanthine dehydrogenase small subunit [Myxococcota bacterium]
MNSIIINEVPYPLDLIPPHTTLLRFLRDHIFLTGTKEGCAEGDCGACSAVVLEQSDEGSRFKAINACLVPIHSLGGHQVWTVEGLSTRNELHPVQSAMVKHLGSQCGYCTPGIVMSLMEAYYRKDIKEPWQIDDQLCGNLCRCTGYRPIRTAAESIINTNPQDAFTSRQAEVSQTIDHTVDGQRFLAPVTWTELWTGLANNPNATLVCGATDLGLDITKKHAQYECIVALDRIPDLKTITVDEHQIRIGAAATISDIESTLQDTLPALTRMYRYFGSRQIKNRASMGGNLCTASPIGDSAPVLLAYDSIIELRSAQGTRTVPISSFFKGYRQIDIQDGEILSAIVIPRPTSNWHIRAFKVSKRREMDISAVSAGMAVQIVDGKIQNIRLAFGGMAATPKRAHRTEDALNGQSWSMESIQAALHFLKDDFTPMNDHRGSAWYRSQLAQNLLVGFYEELQSQNGPHLALSHTGTLLLEQR